MPYRTMTDVNTVAPRASTLHCIPQFLRGLYRGHVAEKPVQMGERRSFDKAQAAMTQVLRIVKKFGGPSPYLRRENLPGGRQPSPRASWAAKTPKSWGEAVPLVVREI